MQGLQGQKHKKVILLGATVLIWSFLPFFIIIRKNLGYLYAIQHGATVIYESNCNHHFSLPTFHYLITISLCHSVTHLADDDNILIHDSVIFEQERNAMAEISAAPNTPVVNPYAYFGAPKVWPRGYPLEHLETRQNFSIIPSHAGVFSPVQQGLADLDPDLDALYRLIFTDEIGHIRFDAQKPAVAVKPPAMTPFNTQNTSKERSEDAKLELHCY
jgi:hypothetical protein